MTSFASVSCHLQRFLKSPRLWWIILGIAIIGAICYCIFHFGYQTNTIYTVNSLETAIY